MNSKIILGSGLVALVARKILGSDWTIIPISPSRFYASGVPALGDDFIVYDEEILDIVDDWGIKSSPPFFFKRPYSISGSLLYNSMFSDRYFNKIGLEETPLLKDYYKQNFMVFPFSCVQLWRLLLSEFVGEIKQFDINHKGNKTIKLIKDHQIVLTNGDVIEYDEMISTIPYYSLCKLTNAEFNGKFQDTYYYFLKDDTIDLEGANQVLVCDSDIPFHKCTKISRDRYLFEIIDTYYDDIQAEFTKIIGGNFEILSAAMVENGHVLPYKLDQNMLSDNGIICVGSHAQCDPLIDLGSAIKRIKNLLKSQKIKQ